MGRYTDDAALGTAVFAFSGLRISSKLMSRKSTQSNGAIDLSGVVLGDFPHIPLVL